MKKRHIFASLFLSLFVFTFLFGIAQASEGNVPYGDTGFVKCGPGIGVENDTRHGYDEELGYIPCTLCDLFVLFNNVLMYFLSFVVPTVAVILFVYGGIKFYSAAGDPGKVSEGMGILKSTIYGLIIIYSAWIVVEAFLNAVGAKQIFHHVNGERRWNVIMCEIEEPEEPEEEE